MSEPFNPAPNPASEPSVSASEQADTAQPTSEQPSYPQPGYTQPIYPQSGYAQPGYAAQPGYPQPNYAPQGSVPQGYAQPAPTPQQSTKNGGTKTGRTVGIAALVAALVGGGVGAGTVALADRNDDKSGGLNVSTATAQNSAKIDGTVSAAAAKIQPSVVTINVSSGQSSANQESGTGSGVIVRSDGYVLTNNHVVSVAGSGGSISIVTTDGRTAAATIVGTDPADDLAVIKISNLNDLTAATFAKSSSIVVGQSVVAVGAPLGLSDTVTAGIVSNTARPVRSGDKDEAVFEAIQTDAAINPGNSGGPLVDLNGNVIGINAAIATANSGGLSIPGQSTESGSIGIGFAIPSDEASRIADQLISTGKATHAVIGASIVGNTSGSSTVVGATIKSVTAGGPAASAGLKAGDVVTAVDSRHVADADSLIAAIRSHAPGETVTLTYTRNGASATAKVTLGQSSE